MEELEGLDREALERQYIDSYKYTTSQKIGGGIMIFVILAFIIVALTTLFMNLINIIKS